MAGRPYHISALYVVDLARLQVLPCCTAPPAAVHALSSELRLSVISAGRAAVWSHSAGAEAAGCKRHAAQGSPASHRHVHQILLHLQMPALQSQMQESLCIYAVDVPAGRWRRGTSCGVVYAQLSQDPNSLANLDQDLPNYAQHQVPIFSLPQVWHDWQLSRP